jgi:hypothetical protein
MASDSNILFGRLLAPTVGTVEPSEVLAGVVQALTCSDARICVETESFFVSARRFEMLRRLFGPKLLAVRQSRRCAS